jgi:hypothetical protein
MMIRRASLAPLTTGPPANTASPADSALVVVLAPFFLTTVSLTTCQVQVVPSAALITTSLPLTDWMMPRSNESVWKPVLLWKVAVPSTPPKWRSRPSAQRTRAGESAWLPASVSAVFSAAARALEPLEAGAPPPDTAAQVIPPPARRPNTAAPTPQRYHFFLGADPEGPGALAGNPPSAGASYIVFILVSVGLGSWTSPGSPCTALVSAPRVRCRRAWHYR